MERRQHIKVYSYAGVAMNRARENPLIVKGTANSNIEKAFKLVGDFEIILFMGLGGIYHGVYHGIVYGDEKYYTLHGGLIAWVLVPIFYFFLYVSPFLVPVSFLSLVIAEGSNLVSNWNKPGRRGFLTLGNIIGLGFLLVLLAAGAYATLVIFTVQEEMSYKTIDFLGVFGIIWTLQWIQKLKNFSSTRDNAHKLIGPLIATIILISGYKMYNRNAIFGPLSCALAPIAMWLFSFIFGDIEGRSNDQDDKTNPFPIIISIILLCLAIYAIRNPCLYGIEVLNPRILKFASDLSKSLKNLQGNPPKVTG